MPIIDIQRAVAEIGRIRLGEQVDGPKGRRPKALNRFRFTSAKRDAVEAIARAYGGTVEEWTPDGGYPQWEVITDATEIPVLVMPADLGFSQYYETWTGAGCVRRCDGFQEITGNDPKPCVCATEPGKRKCETVTRLTVMLPPPATSVFGGWRLTTNSYYAAAELRSAVELALAIGQRRGQHFANATLRVEQRVTRKPGEAPQRFTVPVLDVEIDPAALGITAPTEAVDVAASLTVASPPERSRALPRGAVAAPPRPLTDATGEVPAPPPVAPSGPPPPEGPREPKPRPQRTERQKHMARIFARMADQWPGFAREDIEERRHAVAILVTANSRGECVASFADLTDTELVSVEVMLEDIYSGRVALAPIPHGYKFTTHSGRTARITHDENDQWSYLVADKDEDDNAPDF